MSSPASKAGAPGETEATPVLSIHNLETSFNTIDGLMRAVDKVSFDVHRGELLGVVGESGCGKSMTALSVMGLVQSPPGKVSGSIRLNGRELLGLPETEMRKIRGNEIAMIFQEPMTSLDPVMRVGKQIAEPLVLHQGMSWKAAQAQAIEMLERVRIPEARRRVNEYPHEMSGGMRQRVMIAMGLACQPMVLLADEPTTALDVTIQAQILRLMQDLRSELGTAIVMITHDLGVIAETVDRVVVMYAGKKVEEANVRDLFRQPRHPYTVGLLGSVPKVSRNSAAERERLVEIPGIVPAPNRKLAGCRFAPRCRLASEICRTEEPPFEQKAPAHFAACWHSDRAMEMSHVA